MQDKVKSEAHPTNLLIAPVNSNACEHRHAHFDAIGSPCAGAIDCTPIAAITAGISTLTAYGVRRPFDPVRASRPALAPPATDSSSETDGNPFAELQESLRCMHCFVPLV